MRRTANTCRPRRASLLATSLLAVVGLGALMLTSPVAHAAPVERASGSVPISDSFDGCGIPVTEEGVFTYRYTVGQGTAKTGGQFFRVHQQNSYIGTFTNTATGAYFTSEWHTNFREMPATLVGTSGSIVTYQTKESGVWDTLRDSTGKVRYRSAGNLVFQYVFDTQGDSTPGGLVLDEQFVRTSGHWTTWDADFCAIVNALIG
jgi:hypothetical protein